MMQSQQWPQLTPWGALKLRWPCRLSQVGARGVECFYPLYDQSLDRGSPGRQVWPWGRWLALARCLLMAAFLWAGGISPWALKEDQGGHHRVHSRALWLASGRVSWGGTEANPQISKQWLQTLIRCKISDKEGRGSKVNNPLYLACA